MEFRKVFDTIPEQFDKYRPRYSAELFADLIEYAETLAKPIQRFADVLEKELKYNNRVEESRYE